MRRVHPTSWGVIFENYTSEQQRATVSYKSYKFFDAFRFTVVNFFWEFYKLTPIARIYKRKWAVLTKTLAPKKQIVNCIQSYVNTEH